MIPVLKVIAPGFHTTLQDQGRRGFQHAGIPISGALDRNGYMLSNALVGNTPGAACLEIIGSGPELEVVASFVRITLVGSAGGLEIGGRDGPPVPSGQTARLARGEVVRVRLGGDAFCSYLAIEAGFDVPLCLGSRSTYTRAGFGGLAGRPLRNGDILHGYADDVAARDEVDVRASRAASVSIRRFGLCLGRSTNTSPTLRWGFFSRQLEALRRHRPVGVPPPRRPDA